MDSYIFEAIEHETQYPAKVFVTSIDTASFHWHYDYELMVILKGSLIMLPKITFSVFIQTAAKIGLRSNGKELADVFRIKALIYKLVADLIEYTQYDIRQYPTNVDIEQDSKILLQIIEFIARHLEYSNITQELSKYIGMSEKTLYRFLKSSTGLTVKDIVNSSRIEKSKVMLKQTDKSISFIEQECGFNSEVTFYRIFKKETGVTPNEYRESDIGMVRNLEIQGYLNFDVREAYDLLKQYL